MQNLMQLTTAITFSLLLSACAGLEAISSLGNPAFDDDKFTSWFNDVLEHTENLPKEQRIPLSNDLVTLVAQGFNGQISKQQFNDKMKTQYPGKDTYAKIVSNALP